MTKDQNDLPSVITMQLKNVLEVIESGKKSSITPIDLEKMESRGYVTRERIGPPKPKAPWYPAGKPVTSKELKQIGRLLSDYSYVTFIPADQYEKLTAYESKVDYLSIVTEIRTIITRLLITFFVFEGVRGAKMRIFNDLQDLIKETWGDVEQLIFRIKELSDLFRGNIKQLSLGFNEMLPTYKESGEVKRAMTIETSFQANQAIRVGTSFLACLQLYNHYLKQSGAKHPSLKFAKSEGSKVKKKKDTFFLSDDLIENLAITAYILNIGLYHSSMSEMLNKILSETPPTEEEQREIRKSTYEKTLEIIQAHTILDIPVSRSLLRSLISDEDHQENGDSGMVVDPIVKELLKITTLYFSLTSQRPYRNSYNRSHAIEYICSSLGDDYHIESASLFFSLLQPYTPGEILTLKDSETHTDQYLVKVLDYNKNRRQPLFKSMPNVQVIEKAEGAPDLPSEGGVTNLSDLHMADTKFKEKELVFWGSETKGAIFIAEIEDPEVPAIRLKRCITNQIMKENVKSLVGRALQVPHGNPEKRIWKCTASLYLSDTVPTQYGEMFT